MNQVRSAGIDVSAKTLVVSYQVTPQSKVHTWEVANTAQGHLQLCRKLQQTLDLPRFGGQFRAFALLSA